jgi:hypothetical protein
MAISCSSVNEAASSSRVPPSFGPRDGAQRRSADHLDGRVRTAADELHRAVRVEQVAGQVGVESDAVEGAQVRPLPGAQRLEVARRLLAAGWRGGEDEERHLHAILWQRLDLAHGRRRIVR